MPAGTIPEMFGVIVIGTVFIIMRTTVAIQIFYTGVPGWQYAKTLVMGTIQGETRA